MTTSEILKELRIKNGLTQDEMAERFSVTRQDISRWENGEAMPDADTLKQISTACNISVSTLLGSPKRLYCQCCGMPLNDLNISREPDRSFNEEYCKLCYYNGTFTYKNMDDLIRFLTIHMSSKDFPPEQAKLYFSEAIPKLRHWQKKNSCSKPEE